jgi:hypothetical protein
MNEQTQEPVAQTVPATPEKKDVVVSMDALEAEAAPAAPVKKDVVVQVEVLRGGGAPTRV